MMLGSLLFQKNNRIGGSRAKAEGRSFERCFEIACDKSKVAFIRLPETGGRFVGKGKFKSESIVCDYIIGFEAHTILCDLKSLNEKNLSYSFTRHKSFYEQIRKLSLWQEKNKDKDGYLSKAVSAFIVYLKKSKAVVAFLPSQILTIRPNKSLDCNSAFCKIGTGYKDMNILKLFE